MRDPARRRGHAPWPSPGGEAPPGEESPWAAPVVRASEVAGRGPESTIELEPGQVPLRRGLVALEHRDFRLFWLGQIVSLVGTWMQIVAQDWLVLVLTNSPLALGLVSALQFTPVLAFSVLGGVIADRLPRRTLLLGTQTTAMALALALAVLVSTGRVHYTQILVLATLLGLTSALDMPTRQAFVVELVGPRDLHNAIALNSAAFNAARLVGPAVAGLAIAHLGAAGCFYLNGASFVAVIAGLLAIRAGRRRSTRPVERRSVWEDLREGLAYVVQTPAIYLVVGLMAAVGTFGMNLSVLVPLLARDTLRLDAQGFGFLTSAVGVGSLAAAALLAYLGQAAHTRLLVLAAGGLGLLEVALAGARQFALAAPLLALLGFAMICFTTLSNTSLQTTTPDALRGRVMSLYATVFAGTTPFGSLLMGELAEHAGVGASFLLGGVVSVAAAAVVYLLAAAPRRRA